MYLFFSGLSGVIPWSFDHWRHTQWVGLTLLIAFMLNRFFRRYGIIVFLALMIAIGKAVYVLHFGDDLFSVLRFQFGTWSGAALISTVVFAWVATDPYLISKNKLELVAYLGSIDAIYMCVRGLTTGTYYGIVNNYSFDSAFVACCFFMMNFSRERRPKIKNFSISDFLDLLQSFFIPLVAIAGTRGKTGPVVLAFGLFGYHMVKHTVNTVSISMMAFILSTPLWIGRDLFDLNGRQTVWRHVYELFKIFPNYIWTGFGLGSFETIMPAYEVKVGHKMVFLWAHNEFVQVFFEMGLLGLIALIFVMARCFISAKRSAPLTATLCAITAAMLTQMPFRYMPFQVFILSVLLLCERERDKSKCVNES